MVAIVFVLNDRVGDAVVVRSARLMIFDEEGIIERRAVESLRRRCYYYTLYLFYLLRQRGMQCQCDGADARSKSIAEQ